MKKRLKLGPIKSKLDKDDLEMESEGSDFDDDWDLSQVQLVTNKRELSDDDGDSLPKKKKKLEKELYKPPTADELNQLRETENLFHSNLFRLQIEEILSEVKLKEKYQKLFQTWFPKLKEQIESIEETDECKLSDIDLLQNLDVKISIADLPKETKGTFRFLKPSNISVIGSYSLETVVSPNIIIDIAVEMPANLFQKGDFQNYRFLKKRATYLAHIVSNIKDDVAQEKSFVGNNEKVMLKLVPPGKLGKKCIIYIHVAAQETSFKLNRFLPEKNSVRPGWFFQKGSSEDESLIATPHYNSIILHDMTMLQTNEQNMKLIKEYPNIRDGIILLKIWQSQRELIKGSNAFNGHVMTMYVLYLLRIKKLNTFMSSYQIVRNVWNGLAQSNWSENGISMCQEKESLQRISEYQKHYDCVFLDTTGYHNIAANISKETISWIQDLATVSVKSLDNGQIDSFQILFMRKVPIYRTFDNLICIHETEALKNIAQRKSTKEDKLNFGPNKYLQCVKLIIDVLKKGLGNRLLDVFVLPEQFKEWSVTEDFPENLEKVFIGLNFNPDFYFDVITKGPEGNSPEAAAFRQFWGNKSELRRFNDGSIHEVVVWEKGKSLEEKRSVTKNIILFLFQKKLHLHRGKFFHLGNQMENLLKLKKINITNFEYGTGEEASLRVIQVFNSLEKELTSLTDMPLSITGIQGSSAVCRYTEVFPPLATVNRGTDNVTIEGEKYLLLEEENLKEIPKYVQPIEISIQLLTSGKWPDELEAVQSTKGAFQIQIAECLRKQYKLKAQGSLHYTDVLKNGFVFRLRIAHQKEIALMKQQIGEDGVIKYRDTEESIALEKKLFHLPKLTGALHGLHCQQPSFGPACCLAKRWLSAQMLDDSHFPEIVVELLLASIYLTPDPYKPAQMPQVAFFRLMELFSRCYWISDPIIVNFNNEMTREQVVAIENEFRTARETLPPLFISTPYDHKSSLWTKNAPNLLILNRVCSIAKEALKLIETQIYNSALDCKAIFRTPLTEYDCLIHLKSVYNPRRYEAVEVDENEPIVAWHPYKKHSEHKIPVVNFNPVQSYLKELRSNYSEFALFFHDTYGGQIIGVLFKPVALEPKEQIKVANFHRRKLNSKGQLILDLSTMIENFYIIGKDIISGIDVQSKRVSTN